MRLRGWLRWFWGHCPACTDKSRSLCKVCEGWPSELCYAPLETRRRWLHRWLGREASS